MLRDSDTDVSLDKKTVRVSAVFRSKYGKDEREEDCHDGEADESLNALLSADVTAARRAT